MIQIPDFSQVSILVVGDVMLDRYWSGSAQRISPEAPVPVVRVGNSEDRLGGAGNVAVNLASLGCTSFLVGLVGDDEAGKTVSRLAQERNIQYELPAVTGRPTITKLRVLAKHQQLLRMDFEQAAPFEDPTIVQEAASKWLGQAQAIVLSDYAKGCLSNCQVLIRQARELNIPVLVDPKGNDWETYRGATLITPNLQELQMVAGHCRSDEEIYQKASDVIKRLDLTAALVTLSERGMLLVSKNSAPLHIPAQARDVFDVTGAGDTVVGLLAASLGSGCSLEEAAQLANIGAGIVVGKLGAASVTPTELRAAAQSRFGDILAGVLSSQDLKLEVEAARQRGERIVMTNGCFDILHPGHVRYLQAAAKLGDRLIVAVNSDESVTRLKGSSRPINKLADRMDMLAALDAVDWVVDFSEDTPANLIGQILPDILVKGGDYTPEAIAGFKEVTDAGGEVQILPFEDGYSTSALIDRITRNS